MAFEMQAGRGEIADHLVQRREAPRRIFVRRRETHAHLAFELRARTIAALGGNGTAELLGRIGGYVVVNGAGRRFLRQRRGRTGEACGGTRGEQESAPA